MQLAIRDMVYIGMPLCLDRGTHLITSKIMLNVEKLTGSPEIDRLSVTQTSITTAALPASGDRSTLFSDNLLFFVAPSSLCSGSPPPLGSPAAPPRSCTEKNVAVAGMHLKRVCKICHDQFSSRLPSA